MTSTDPKAFGDLGIPTATTNNYTWEQIQVVQNQINNRAFNDLENDVLIISNVDNDFSPDSVELTQIGTNCDTVTSNKVVSIGHNLLTEDSDTVINIGGDSDPTQQTVINSDATICIGFNNDIGNSDEIESGLDTICIGNDNQIRTDNSGVGAISKNIVVGHVSGLSTTGTNNISIGHSVDNDRPNIDHTIVLSTAPLLGNKPVNNSIVFGGSNNQPASADARVQFLSQDLLAEGAGAAFPAAYDAVIRINYRGTNYRIPVFTDP